MGKKKLTKYRKLEAIAKRIPYGYGSTLADVLYTIKRKFRIEDLNDMRLQKVIATWRWNRDYLEFQYGYCIDLIYYLLIEIPNPYGKKEHAEKATAVRKKGK